MVPAFLYRLSFQQSRVQKLLFFWKWDYLICSDESSLIAVLGTWQSLYLIRLWKLTMCQKYNSCEPYVIFHLTKHIFLGFWTHAKSNKPGIQNKSQISLAVLSSLSLRFLKSDDLHDNADKMGDYYTSYALEVTNNQTTLVDNLIKKMKRPDFPICRFRSDSIDEVCLRSRCSVRGFLVKLDNVQLSNACKSFLVT